MLTFFVVWICGGLGGVALEVLSYTLPILRNEMARQYQRDHGRDLAPLQLRIIVTYPIILGPAAFMLCALGYAKLFKTWGV